MAILGRLLGEGLQDAGEDIVEKGVTKSIKKAAKETGESTLSKLGKKIPVSYSDNIAQDIAVKAPEMVQVYRGMAAKTDDELKQYLQDMVDYNIKPRTYSGRNVSGEGYNSTTNPVAATQYANTNPVKESRVVLTTELPKNRFIQQNAANENRLQDFINRADVQNDLDNAKKFLQPKEPLTLYHGSPIKGIKDLDINMAGKNDKYEKITKKAKNYKNAERFEKMNNPIKGSEIWGDKPTSAFQRDTRAVRVNMFPNEAVKGTGMTKQYLLNMFKDAYDQGITSIVPSYGIYTKEGSSFMDHLVDQGWLAKDGNYGYKIAPKIAEWEKTEPLRDIYNKAHNKFGENDDFGKSVVVDKLKDSGADKYLPGVAENKDSLVEMARRIKKLREIESNSHTIQDGVKRIGSANVAPVDPSTLPDGWKELEEYLDNAKNRLEKELGKPRSSITKQDLIDYLEEVGYDTEGTKDQLWKNALMAIDDNAVDELYNAGGGAGMFLQDRLPFRTAGDLTDATNYYIGNKGRTGRLDAEYSDRLGIGRSNTPMSDNVVSTRGSAQGSYSKGGFGTNPMWATGESGVSTAAHERMHAWQDINKYDWDERVVDAIDELREELKKYYHDEDTIKKYHGTGKTDYYARDIEQEARMLQSYLDNEGYTDTSRRHSERGTEWGNEIKPAFDKFFDKLRALSKAGVALPAIAAVFGLAGSNGQDGDKNA